MQPFDIPLGAHLTSPRRGYTHHGIYAGAGRVLHYAGFSRALRRGPVVETTLDEFARGRSWAVSAREPSRYAGEAALERARTRLGENRYRFWSNNCEHFVEWSLEGVGRSRQVERWHSAVHRAVGALVPRRPAAAGRQLSPASP